MADILEIDSVILDFGSKRVLQDVHLVCEIGKVTGLLGRNGTGKTCLMKIIYGQLNPLNNSVRINRKALLNSVRTPDKIMYLPQVSFIPRHLTLKRIFKDLGHDFTEFISQFPEFDKYYNSKFKVLSGGERRIVEIYIILISKTKFCLLDEPFSHVMPIHIDLIKNLILKEKNKKGIIITDHLFEHVLDISDKLYVLSNGKTHLTENPDDIEKLGYAITKK